MSGKTRHSKAPLLLTRRRVAALVAAWPVALVASRAFAQAEQRNLVTDATVTLANFINDPDMTWLKQNFKRAKAVLIAPQIAKAGFIIGGSGGHAALARRFKGQQDVEFCGIPGRLACWRVGFGGGALPGIRRCCRSRR